jgi:hypothetical protein
MPPEPSTTNPPAAPATTPAADHTTPPAAGGTPALVDFDAWLKAQSAEVQAAYASHTQGLKSALDAERAEKRKLEKEQKDKRTADEAAAVQKLEADKDFQKLAEQRGKKLDELQQQVATLAPTAERVKALDTALGAILAKEREGLPAHIITLLDALAPEKQLEYLAANRAALKPATSIPATPPPGGAVTVSPEERRKQAWQPSL